MYCYLSQQPTTDEGRETAQQIFTRLSSMGIDGKRIDLATNAELYKDGFATRIPAECTTLIAVGDDETFEALLSLSSQLPEATAYGFVPTAKTSQIAKQLGLKDWREATTTIRSRRLEPTLLLRFRGGIVLFEKTFSSHSKINNKDAAVVFQINQNLELRAPAEQIHITNNSKDELSQTHVLSVSAFHQATTPSHLSKESILPLQHLQARRQQNEPELLFRIGANSCHVQGAQLIDNYGRAIVAPLTVRATKNPIRLIVKKATTQSNQAL